MIKRIFLFILLGVFISPSVFARSSDLLRMRIGSKKTFKKLSNKIIPCKDNEPAKLSIETAILPINDKKIKGVYNAACKYSKWLKPKAKKSIYTFYNIFKEKKLKVIHEVKIGVRYFYSSTDMSDNENWTLTHFDRFALKIQTSFGRYLQVYLLYSNATTRLVYKPWLDKYTKKYLDMNFSVDSRGSNSFGAGMNILLFQYKWKNDWRNLSFYQSFEIESTSLQDATPSSAMIKYNKVEFDISDEIQDMIDMNYSRKLYTMSTIVHYRLLPWMLISARFGYIWFNATIKINADQKLLDMITALANINASNIIPKRLSITQDGFFGLFSLRFRLHKPLYLDIEGSMLPASDYLIYFLQASLVFRI